MEHGIDLPPPGISNQMCQTKYSMKQSPNAHFTKTFPERCRVPSVTADAAAAPWNQQGSSPLLARRGLRRDSGGGGGGGGPHVHSSGVGVYS